MNLDARSQSRAGVAHHAQRRKLERRLVCTSVNRDPDLRRNLGANAVELQRAEQTDGCLRRGRTCQHQAMMFSDGMLRQTIDAARDAFEFPRFNQTREGLA